MKKILIASISLLLVMSSCNVKSSKEYKTLEAQRDSLLQENLQGEAEANEMLDIIKEVEENFEQIKEAEKYLTIESKSSGEMSRNTKAKVRDNFSMINDILLKNKEQINKLNQRLNSSSGNSTGLKKTIELLNKELEEKAAAMEELKVSLARKDKEIATLKVDVQGLEKDVDMLATHAEQQAIKLKEQEDAMYAAYYMFGSLNELKESAVAQGGGFLSTLKLRKEGLSKDKFVKIDSREVTKIPVFSTKCNVLTDHPLDSYTVEKNAEGMATVVITDAEKFWNVSKFLVIEVK